MPDRPGRPSCVGELGMSGELTCLWGLQPSSLEEFSRIAGYVGDTELEWTMFKATIVAAAVKSCGQKVKGACWGGKIQPRWWTSEVQEAVNHKKEAIWAWMPGGSVEAPDRYLTRRAAAKAVTEAKTRV